MTGHGCEDADSCVLWYDLHAARQSAQNGRWSIQCEYIQGRIEKLTKLVGPTPWGSIQIGLIEDGLYQKINRDLGSEVLPDMARVAEVRERISQHPFRQREGTS